jgi:ATP-dependent RNA helicase DDX31/DBP7
MDDGIELNFAAPAAGGSSRFEKKKQGGRWTDRCVHHPLSVFHPPVEHYKLIIMSFHAYRRLKANKAAKRRLDKDPAEVAKVKKTPNYGTTGVVTKPPPKQASQRPASGGGSSRPGGTAQNHNGNNFNAGSGSQNGNNVRDAPPHKRPRTDGQPSNATSNSKDDFANVDIAALARRSTTSSAQQQQQGSSSSSYRPGAGATYQSHLQSRQGGQGQGGQGGGVVSGLFTGMSSNRTNARDGQDQAGGDEDEDEDNEGMDKMDRRLHLNASNAPDVESHLDGIKDDRTFEGLGLDPLLVEHLQNKMGIQRPTRIQRVALKGLLDPTPLTLGVEPAKFSLVEHARKTKSNEGPRDAFIQSQTGSGKTLSYLLPIIQTLLPLASSKDVGYVDRSIGTLGIVLAPTRELARQIWGVTERILGMRLSVVLDDEARTMKAVDGGVVKEDGSLPEEDEDVKEEEEVEVERRKPVYQRFLVTTLLTGGSTRTHEKSRLRKGCPILISTPGRLLDHLQNTSSFKVDRLLWLVLDEADRLIEEGFGETLEGIMKAIEGRRRIGIEMDGQGLGRSKKKKFVPGKTMNNKIKAPFEMDEDDEDEDGDEDDDWDYELSGPKPNAKKTSFAPDGTVVKEELAAMVAGTNVSTQMNWPYWGLGRRTILCSATVSGEVQKLAGTALKNPIMYRASDAGKIDEDEEEEEEEPELKDLAQVGAGQGQKKGEDVPEEPEQEPEEEIQIVGKGADKFTPPSQLDQRYMIVPLKLRLVTLVSLLRTLIAKGNIGGPSGQGMKVIVFMSCTDSVDFHWKLMGGVQMGAPPKAEGDEDEDEEDEDAIKQKKKKEKAKKEQEPISYTCPLLPSTSIMRLHGSLPLQTRRESLQAFANATTAEDASKHSILFCTSVASRGLDLPLVRAVIQYDLPTEQGVAEYVHRVGRTARVGKGGESWAFVENAEKDWVPWVREGMSSNEKDGDKVKMRQVVVEDVLKRGFSPRGGHADSREFEQRATQVQLAFERWVLDSNSVSSRIFICTIREPDGSCSSLLSHRMPTSRDRRFRPMSEPTRRILTKRSASSTSKTFISVISPSRSVSVRRQARSEVAVEARRRTPREASESEAMPIAATTIRKPKRPRSEPLLLEGNHRQLRRISKRGCTQPSGSKESSPRLEERWPLEVGMRSSRSR